MFSDYNQPTRNWNDPFFVIVIVIVFVNVTVFAIVFVLRLFYSKMSSEFVREHCSQAFVFVFVFFFVFVFVFFFDFVVVFVLT